MSWASAAAAQKAAGPSTRGAPASRSDRPPRSSVSRCVVRVGFLGMRSLNPLRQHGQRFEYVLLRQSYAALGMSPLHAAS